MHDSLKMWPFGFCSKKKRKLIAKLVTRNKHNAKKGHTNFERPAKSKIGADLCKSLHIWREVSPSNENHANFLSFAAPLCKSALRCAFDGKRDSVLRGFGAWLENS